MTDHVIRTAKQIVDLGVVQPDLFVAMALFEEGFGPDRISDMTANVILPNLIAFTERVSGELGIPQERFIINLRNGKTYEGMLPRNSTMRGDNPVILIPMDILRELPIARDWSDIASVASRNASLRQRVNDEIAALWQSKTLKNKGEIRRWALSGREPFETLLDMINQAAGQPYDALGDPAGELFWKNLAATLASTHPFSLSVPPNLDRTGIVSVVNQIVGQFGFLIEQRRLSEELYHAGKPRPEKSAQRIFFAVAYSYCKAHNLDLTPEADTGNGPVDFKVSNGFTGRVLVEIKLSTNTKVVKGYTRQLEMYKNAEETLDAFYVVIDVGGMGEKADQLVAIKNAAAANGHPVSEIVFVDGRRRVSASKL